MKKETVFRTAGAMVTGGMLVASLAACGSSPDISPVDGDKPFAGQTLTVMNWQEYGSDLPWVIDEFEQRTGATVIHQYKNSDQGAIQMLQSGGIGKIDVAVVNHAYMTSMIEDDLLQPVDTSTVDGYDELYPALVDVGSLKHDGKIYGVPWLFGVTSLAFDPEKVTSGTDSWSILWDRDFAGKIAFFDDPQTAIQTAALYLGEDPAKPDMVKVESALKDLKEDLKLLWGSANDWTRAFSTGQVVIGNAWSGLPAQVPSPSVQMSIPKEGAVGWLDSWTIVKDTPHPELAQAWIDFMTSTDFQSKFAQDASGQTAIPANEVAATLPGVGNTGISANDLNRLNFVNITAEQLEEWTKLWQAIKAG